VGGRAIGRSGAKLAQRFVSSRLARSAKARRLGATPQTPNCRASTVRHSRPARTHQPLPLPGRQAALLHEGMGAEVMYSEGTVYILG